MMQWMLVGAGGALGAMLRYGASLAAIRLGAGFPWGTLIVNVIGGLAMGLLAARTEDLNWRLLLGVGVLGGFTTFSAFSLESVRLLQSAPHLAALYVASSLVLSIGACWLGLVLGRP